MEPVRWPVPAGAARGEDGESGGELFADGRFFTESRKARLVATEPRGPAGLVCRYRIPPNARFSAVAPTDDLLMALHRAISPHGCNTNFRTLFIQLFGGRQSAARELTVEGRIN